MALLLLELGALVGLDGLGGLVGLDLDGLDHLDVLVLVQLQQPPYTPSCDSSQWSLGKILACRIHSCKAFPQCDFSRDAEGRRP